MAAENQAPKPEMDANNLYREDVFTDQKVGTIRRLTPVTRDGTEDKTRAVQFFGQASLYTPAGTLPLNFELEAKTLDEAVAKFADAAGQAVEETMKQLQELRREAASSIVLPEAGQPGFDPHGGIPSGKIKLR